jgi:hypothetical protein
MVVHCYLSHLRLPVSASLDEFLSAYRLSLETGDIAMGAICLCNYHWVYKFCGLPLGPFASDLRQYLNELRLCHQEFLLAFMLPDLHLALNLTGQTDHPTAITWERIRESSLFEYNAVIAREHPAELNRIYTQMFNAIILQDMALIEESVAGVLSRKKPFRRFDGTHMCNQFFIFLEGLSGFALIRKRNSKKSYKTLAADSIRELTRMSRSGSINCTGMLQFLKAEEMALRMTQQSQTSWQRAVEITAVRKSYDSASAQLSRSGFFHYSALANEHVGCFMLRHDDQFWGEHYLSRAVVLYRDWGATVKVQQMLMEHQFIRLEEEVDPISTRSRISVRARPRYDSMYDSVINLGFGSKEFDAELKSGASDGSIIEA